MRPNNIFTILLGFSLTGCASKEASDFEPTDSNVISLEAETVELAPGDQTTRCTFVKSTNDAEVFVQKINIDRTAGAHHTAIYTVDHDIDSAPLACRQGGQPAWNILYAGQELVDVLDLPAGVGFSVKPHQQFVIESHYINASSHAVTSTGTVKLTLVTGDTSHIERAAPIFFGTWNIQIPARASGHAQVTCSPPGDVNILQWFGHTHSYATSITASIDHGTGSGNELVYETDDWENAVVSKYGNVGGFEIAAADKVTVACDWDNTTDHTMGYPEEMCQMAGMYWPATNPTICFSGSGSDQCNCYPLGVPDPGAGKAMVNIHVTRAETIPGVVGNPAAGRPIYCFLTRQSDIESLGAAAFPMYFGDQVNGKLETTADSTMVSVRDVAAGDYQVSCTMDTLYGGPFPGVGTPVTYPGAAITVGEDDINLALEFNAAVPPPAM